MKKLTEKEILYYSDYGLIEECDLCHEYFAFIDIDGSHKPEDLLEFNGWQFLCWKCR